MIFKSLFNLFFPEVCLSCHLALSDHEMVICTDCRHHLPILNNSHNESDNLVKKALYGRVNLVDGAALFKFEKKGHIQQLLHELKYKKEERLSGFFGEWLGEHLKHSEFFKDIDVVIPVPLHPSKLKQRGYNQVAGFGKALADCLDASYNDVVLLKQKSTNSQVFKNRLERWQLNNEMFVTQYLDSLEGKHILLVDDIITTGATLEACANELLKAQHIKISVATIAIA